MGINPGTQQPTRGDHVLFRAAHKVISTALAFSTWAVLGANVLSSLIFPFVETIIKDQTKFQVNNLPFVQGLSISLYVIYGVHFLIGVYAIVGLFKLKEFMKFAKIDEMEQGFLKINNDLIDEKARSNKLRSQREEIIKREIAIQASLTVLQALLSDETLCKPTEHDIESILAPLVKDRTDAMGFSSADMHNFAVYIYNKPESRLDLFHRICDDRIPRQDRSWPIGQGHVGIAFAQNRTIITSDVVHNDDLAEVLQSYSKADEKFYASFISAPFALVKNNIDVIYGVLVITSSRPEHFNEDERLLAISYSVILSMYFSTCEKRGQNEQKKQTCGGTTAGAESPVLKL